MILSVQPGTAVIATDYGPVTVELDWLRDDDLEAALNPPRARLHADRAYDGLEWCAEGSVALDDQLRAGELTTTVRDPLNPTPASEKARQAWASEAARFVDEHVTPELVLSLVRSGADGWLDHTARRVENIQRLLAKAQTGHRRADLVHTVACQFDPEVRVAAAALVDRWEGSGEELLEEARRRVHGAPAREAGT